MFEALLLLHDLDDRDALWMLDTGRERQVKADETILREGEIPRALFIVLEGLVGVHVESAGSRQLATLGPGELLGEISFVEDRPASATVKAAESSLLLEVSRDDLQRRIDEEPAFAARLYRSFARIAARRLRERVAELGARLRDATQGAVEGPWEVVLHGLQHLKALIQRADQAALKHQGQVPEEIAGKLVEAFREACRFLNQELGPASGKELHVIEDLGARVQCEVLPYLSHAQTADRFYSKPRGYAGDYKTIEMIYRNQPQGTGRTGALLDRCFLNEPAAKAVRNRRRLLAREIQKTIAACRPAAARITSLACGPAEELFDVYQQLDDPHQLEATLIDIDQEALDAVRQRASKLENPPCWSMFNGNLVYLATGRQTLEIPPQDLVYSIGLIDYFNDKFVVKLMDYIYQLLKPGGRVILGNFHPDNTTRALMDHVLNWRLIHRVPEDMDRLFARSRFARACTNVDFEDERINLFAECVRSD